MISEVSIFGVQYFAPHKGTSPAPEMDCSSALAGDRPRGLAGGARPLRVRPPMTLVSPFFTGPQGGYGKVRGAFRNCLVCKPTGFAVSSFTHGGSAPEPPHTGVCETNIPPKNNYPLEDRHWPHQIRGWSAVSAAGLLGQGSGKRSCTIKLDRITILYCTISLNIITILYYTTIIMLLYCTIL